MALVLEYPLVFGLVRHMSDIPFFGIGLIDGQ